MARKIKHLNLTLPWAPLCLMCRHRWVPSTPWYSFCYIDIGSKRVKMCVKIEDIRFNFTLFCDQNEISAKIVHNSSDIFYLCLTVFFTMCCVCKRIIYLLDNTWIDLVMHSKSEKKITNIVVFTVMIVTLSCTLDLFSLEWFCL